MTTEVINLPGTAMSVAPGPKLACTPVVPPIKCQGIKTKLVPFISNSISWDQSRGGRWIEPFLGSGVVLFSLKPQRALVSDNNEHIINFYRSIQAGLITSESARTHLESNGEALRATNGDHYYTVRDRFNSAHDPLDFLFLSRSCFNGVMRFNKKGAFNVPFCKKPDRFAKAYVTKIVNQIDRVAEAMEGRDWTFTCADFRETIRQASADDFLYLDPPYVGRHTGYITAWTDSDANDLADLTSDTPAGFALSMWRENRYRTNEHLETHWRGNESVDFEHFYHVGSTESLRSSMTETLIVKPGHLSHSTYPASRPDRLQSR